MENLNGSIIVQGVSLSDFYNIMAECTIKRLSDLLEKRESKTDTPDEQLLTERDAAEFTKLSRQTLKAHRDAGILNYVRIGGSIRYNKSELRNHGRKLNKSK